MFTLCRTACFREGSHFAGLATHVACMMLACAGSQNRTLGALSTLDPYASVLSIYSHQERVLELYVPVTRLLLSCWCLYANFAFLPPSGHLLTSTVRDLAGSRSSVTFNRGLWSVWGRAQPAMADIVDPTVPLVKNVLLLDSEGKRIAVKYYGNDW